MKPNINDFPDSKEYFKTLSPRELDHLEIKFFRPGDVLIQEGNTVWNNLYLILSGVCFGEKRRLSNHKERTIHLKIYKNQFVGVYEMLSNRAAPNLITIYAKTEVSVLVIGRETLAEWQSLRPALFNTILSIILDQHFDNQNILMNCLNYEPFTAFIYYLCHLYEVYLYSCFPQGYTGSVKIHDTREDLCYYSRKDIRTINRYIRQLSDDQLVSICKGKLHITRQQYSGLLCMMEKLS